MIPDKFGFSKIISGKNFNRALIFPFTVKNSGSKQLIINQIIINLKENQTLIFIFGNQNLNLLFRYFNIHCNISL